MTPEQYAAKAREAIEAFIVTWKGDEMEINDDDCQAVTDMVAFMVESSVRSAVAEDRLVQWKAATPVQPEPEVDNRPPYMEERRRWIQGERQRAADICEKCFDAGLTIKQAKELITGDSVSISGSNGTVHS